MNRQQAEQLLGQLILDELDGPTRDALLVYLDTDPQLREQLADMRLTVKLLQQAAVEETKPILSDSHHRQLMKQVNQAERAYQHKGVLFSFRTWSIAHRRIIEVAAVLLIGTFLLGLYSLQSSDEEHLDAVLYSRTGPMDTGGGGRSDGEWGFNGKSSEPRKRLSEKRELAAGEVADAPMVQLPGEGSNMTKKSIDSLKIVDRNAPSNSDDYYISKLTRKPVPTTQPVAKLEEEYTTVIDGKDDDGDGRVTDGLLRRDSGRGRDARWSESTRDNTDNTDNTIDNTRGVVAGSKFSDVRRGVTASRFSSGRHDTQFGVDKEKLSPELYAGNLTLEANGSITSQTATPAREPVVTGISSSNSNRPLGEKQDTLHTALTLGDDADTSRYDLDYGTYKKNQPKTKEEKVRGIVENIILNKNRVGVDLIDGGAVWDLEPGDEVAAKKTPQLRRSGQERQYVLGSGVMDKREADRKQILEDVGGLVGGEFDLNEIVADPSGSAESFLPPAVVGQLETFKTKGKGISKEADIGLPKDSIPHSGIVMHQDERELRWKNIQRDSGVIGTIDLKTRYFSVGEKQEKIDYKRQLEIAADENGVKDLLNPGDSRETHDFNLDSDKAQFYDEGDPANQVVMEKKKSQVDALREKQNKVQELLRQAVESTKDQKFDDAIKLNEQVLFVDPDNVAAKFMREMLIETQLMRQMVEVDGQHDLSFKKTDKKSINDLIPNSEIMMYPVDWPELTGRRLKILQNGEYDDSEINLKVGQRLGRNIPVDFKAKSLESAVEYFRNATGVDVVTNWRALEDAGIKKDQPVTLNLKNVPATKALGLILDEVDGEQSKLGYTIEDGIVIIATKEFLSNKPIIHVDNRALIVSVPDFDKIPEFDLNTLLTDSGRFAIQIDQAKKMIASGDIKNARGYLGKARATLLQTEKNRNKREHQNQIQQWVRMDKQLQGLVEQQQQTKAQAAQEQLPTVSKFKLVPVNPWVLTAKDHQSTFALDVDDASYAICRNYIMKGYLPPRGAVRMEAFVNHFDYNYPRQTKGVFQIDCRGAASPFINAGEKLTLLKIGVQGKVIGREGRRDAHLVFVVDTSGSMARPDRLPLVKYALRQLIDQLGVNDRISLVTYGTGSRLILENEPMKNRKKIHQVIASLRSGGSTNMLNGLEDGYKIAARSFKAGKINRVMLLSDGVANIGETDAQGILKKVKIYKNHGITFTAAGFGAGGYNDAMLEQLAKNGDGNYVFIDSKAQAQTVFVDKMNSTLQTIAKDAKIQVEFNPDVVRRYRLVGYEKRDIADKDFRNDTIDAAEVGSGQAATALYEVELIRQPKHHEPTDLGTVYVRYKDVDTNKVHEISKKISRDILRLRSVEDDPRFYLAACAARFAEILRASEHVKNGNLQQVQRVIEQVCVVLPLDQQARELLMLVRKAQGLPRSP